MLTLNHNVNFVLAQPALFSIKHFTECLRRSAMPFSANLRWHRRGEVSILTLSNTLAAVNLGDASGS